jgi:hypothetical protein
MTIDPKAAELAKALADAVAAQQTQEYQELAEAAKRKAEIDAQAEEAFAKQQYFYQEKLFPVREANSDPWKLGGLSDEAIRQGTHTGVFVGTDQPDESIFDPPSSDPAHYELPEDETQTAKPNGGLTD